MTFNPSVEQQDFKKFFVSVEPVGSRITCDPAPQNTDEDYLCYIGPLDQANLNKNLERIGFDAESMATYEDDSGEHNAVFMSYRRDDVNLIVTAKKEFFDKFMLATYVAKTLNLLQKEQRITLFQAILYQHRWSGPIEMMSEIGEEHVL